MNNQLKPHYPHCLVLFDFDGTIADSLPLMVNTFKDIARQHRHHHLNDLLDLVIADKPLLDHPTIKLLRHRGLEPAISSLKLNKFQLAILYFHARWRFAHSIDQLQPIPGIAPVLSALSSLYTLGIVTSNSTASVQRFLANHHLPYFSIVQSQTNLFAKGSTITKVIHQGGYQLPNVLYIGDEVRDIQAAHTAGIDSIGVNWGFNHTDLLAWQDATAIVDQPHQLPLAIERIFAK